MDRHHTAEANGGLLGRVCARDLSDVFEFRDGVKLGDEVAEVVIPRVARVVEVVWAAAVDGLSRIPSAVRRLGLGRRRWGIVAGQSSVSDDSSWRSFLAAASEARLHRAWERFS